MTPDAVPAGRPAAAPAGRPPRWRARLWGWWRGDGPAADLDPSRTDLVVVASGFDDAEACSTTLARASAEPPAWDPATQVVLRHHLVLPADQVADAVAVAAQDGYQPIDADRRTGAIPGPVPGQSGPTVREARVLVLARVQVLDALHCSQERSRMAGLAQRRDGRVLGWDALQPLP